jgi:hypothetical protein
MTPRGPRVHPSPRYGNSPFSYETAFRWALAAGEAEEA